MEIDINRITEKWGYSKKLTDALKRCVPAIIKEKTGTLEKEKRGQEIFRFFKLKNFLRPHFSLKVFIYISLSGFRLSIRK